MREDKPDGTKDTLHLNDDGETIEAQGIFEYYQRQPLPPAMTMDTKVSLFADATDGLGGAMPATAVTLPQARSTPAIVERSANYTARTGETIYANTSAGSFTITLPAGGGTVTIVDAARSWATNPLTIVGNGGTVDGTPTMSTADYAEYAIAFRRPPAAAAWGYSLSYQYGA